jgi:DtxR family Mn-dependent transcriptional regulator
MSQEITHTVEDYLKTIYQITSIHERASTNQIAMALDLAPASVTGMIKKLNEIDPPVVEYQKHRGVVLTEKGESIALEIIRHHRLIEMFLHEVLDYEWDEVHPEADRLEHVISEEFEERIAKALGNPSHDPHGDPIPTRDLVMPDRLLSPLYDLRPGQEAVVLQVRDENPELLRYLSGLGIIPNASLRILEYSPLDENLSLQVSGKTDQFVLGPRITQEIFVKVNN